MRISSVCTIATRECVTELFLFLKCLRWWHPTVPVHIRTEDAVLYHKNTILSALARGKYAVPTNSIHFHNGLESYRPINRRLMERTPGKKYRTRHDDFMMEKAVVLRDALQAHGSSLFLDCDIVFLRPLDDLADWSATNQTSTKKIILSPHNINERDESLFGRFNGGWVATNDQAVPGLWEEYTRSSRYYDQAALEQFAQNPSCTVEYARPQSNFGYWRLFQAQDPRAVLNAMTLSHENKKKSIMFESQPLQSVHSHLMLPEWCGTSAKAFNRLIIELLKECGDSYGCVLDSLDHTLITLAG